MEIFILTLFPDIVRGPVNQSILKRAQDKGIVDINIINIRDFAKGRHKQADDLPYGGGPGMVMKVEPIYDAVQSIGTVNSKILLMTPAGHRFNQKWAETLKIEKKLIFICGHYEGIDERIRILLNPISLSIGDYVLTNGALAASVITDSIVRLIPGVLGNDESAQNDSFLNGNIEFPQYTRPQSFKGQVVPDVLLSGNHQEIEKWRNLKTEQLTRQYQNNLSFSVKEDK